VILTEIISDHRRYVHTAEAMGATALVMALLGGQAGLRAGEMLALEWTDIDVVAGQLRIDKSCWRGTITIPKGGKGRFVPLTARLSRALRAHRHLRWLMA
jgi:integrase